MKSWRRRWCSEDYPGGSLRHVDQNIETAYAHFYGLSVQRELLPSLTASVEYSGSTGRKLYDLADPNKPGASLCTPASADQPPDRIQALLRSTRR